MTDKIAAAFYKFATLDDYRDLQGPLRQRCEERGVLGTILLAAEGINGTIAGAAQDVRAVLDYLREDPRLRDLEHKESPVGSAPFYRMKVRLKREIVTMGVTGLDPGRQAGTYVKPEDWNALLDDPDVILIDARNDYEVAIGTFEGAINPGTSSFRELPAWLREQRELSPDARVAMFCTGGIRCEKSTAFLRAEGIEEVFHLQGGILKYLETVPPDDSRWHGECFVFDERVSVGHGLQPGSYQLCRACRFPLDEDDLASDLYVAGVSCPHCHDDRSAERKQRYAERQRQMELAEERGQTHLGVNLAERKR